MKTQESDSKPAPQPKAEPVARTVEAPVPEKLARFFELMDRDLVR